MNIKAHEVCKIIKKIMILEIMWSKSLHSETQRSITVRIRNHVSETRIQKHNMMAATPSTFSLPSIPYCYGLFFEVY
jgi:hypothetical protein